MQCTKTSQEQRFGVLLRHVEFKNSMYSFCFPLWLCCVVILDELNTDRLLQSLLPSFKSFVLNYWAELIRCKGWRSQSLTFAFDQGCLVTENKMKLMLARQKCNRDEYDKKKELTNPLHDCCSVVHTYVHNCMLSDKDAFLYGVTTIRFLLCIILDI